MIMKWAGGKRHLWPFIEERVPSRVWEYCEPFVGGGAIWLTLKPCIAVINDINEELINVYKTIRDDVDSLIEDLKGHKNESSHFYAVRGLDRDKEAYAAMTDVQKASRTLYLNKTCYNGLFRVNSKGEFNSPFASYKNPKIVNEPGLRKLNKYLNEADITFLSGDFAQALQRVQEGAFVYLDPPYDDTFTEYSKERFDRKEQERLKVACDDLNKRGVRFLLSNSATDFVLDLYKDYRITMILSKRSINSRGDGRGRVSEILVDNPHV